MARNYRRVKRTRDMAWVVGAASSTVIANAEGEFFGASALFLFDDIDSDDARLAQDKSDWFIKRVIIDMYAVAELDGLGIEHTSRLFNVALCTADTARISIDDSEDMNLITSNFYDSTARVLQTANMPVYHANGLPVGTTTSISPDAGILSASSNSAGVEATGYLPMFPQWGPAALHWDFKTVAGLRANQGLYLCRSDSTGPGPYDWVEGDDLFLQSTYRVLLQKRRT